MGGAPRTSVWHPRGVRAVPGIAVLSVLGLLAPLLLASPAGGAPIRRNVTAIGTTSVSWAYGGTSEAAATSLDGSVAIGYTDASNYAVVLNQTSDGSGGWYVAMTRVLGTLGYFAACYPNCTSPVESIRGTSNGYEFEAARLHLVPGGSVTENGSARSALGLADEQLTLTGNLTVRFVWQNRTDPSRPSTEWFNATTAANTTGNFSTSDPLGLVPRALAPGLAWNGSTSFSAEATTSYSGALSYQGTMIPPLRTPFGGTTRPISPMTASVGGVDAGSATSPSIAGAAVVRLSPTDTGTNLLEGALLVPTSAYLFGAFSSSCYLAQRPCVADASTPELDYAPNATEHLGWQAAVSSVSAFACWFDASAVRDTPDGEPFWTASSGIGPTGARPNVPASPAATTVTGLPIPVDQARAIQRAWHPAVAGSLGPSAGPPLPRPSPHTGRELGLPAPPGSLSPIGDLPAPGSRWLLPVGIATAGAVAVALLLAAGRRRRPARRRPDPEGEASPPPAEAAAAPSDDEPMGYVW